MSGAPLPTSEPTPQPASVRLAGPADEDGIFALLMAAHEENGLLAVSEPKVRAALHAMLNPTDGRWAMIGVIKDGAEIVASVGLELSTFWYSDEWFLSERWNFVSAAHRRSNHARDLIDFAKWASDSLGVTLEAGIISTIRTEAKIRLYRRQLQPVGAFFVHGLERSRGPLARSEAN